MLKVKLTWTCTIHLISMSWPPAVCPANNSVDYSTIPNASNERAIDWRKDIELFWKQRQWVHRFYRIYQFKEKRYERQDQEWAFCLAIGIIQWQKHDSLANLLLFWFQLRETDEDLRQSSRLMNSMIMRSLRERAVLFGVCVVLGVVVFSSIYFSLSHNWLTTKFTIRFYWFNWINCYAFPTWKNSLQNVIGPLTYSYIIYRYL